MTKPSKEYPSAKNNILKIAKEILLEDGLGRLTTDNLIEKSGLSKGGFFYHFKTIDDLIFNLVESLYKEFEDNIQARVTRDPVKKGATSRAIINYVIDDDDNEHLALSRCLIRVISSKSYLDEYSVYYKALMEKALSEDLDMNTVLTISYALDGYWYNRVLGLNFTSDKNIKVFLKGLEKLTY